jgi:hypothetical protein
MSAAEELSRQIVELQSRAQGANEALLNDINLALSGILEAMERTDTSVADAIVNGLKGLQITADVNVTVPTQPPAEVVVNVQAAQVTVPPAQVTVMPAQTQITGWRLSVVSRDGGGAIRELLLKPEN